MVFSSAYLILFDQMRRLSDFDFACEPVQIPWASLAVSEVMMCA
jgi:hypothetical protein